MSVHINSAFKNTCVKTPVNPLNQHPCPNYEREVVHFSSKVIKPTATTVVVDKNCDLSEKVKNITSLVHFYDSIPGNCICNTIYVFIQLNNGFNLIIFIPDYKDVNHLSEKDFYAKLDTLKRKQNELNNYFFRDSCPKVDCLIDGNHTENYQTSTFSTKHITPNPKQNDYVVDNNVSPLSWTQNERNYKKCPNKSVRINSAKSNAYSMRSDLSCANFKDNYELFLTDSPKKVRSKSASPLRSTPRLTVPKPFKMTQR